MKKNISSKTQDADHSKGQEGNAPTGKKGKTNNSQPMNSMRESEEQKAGRTKEQQNENDYRQNDSHNQQEETNY